VLKIDQGIFGYFYLSDQQFLHAYDNSRMQTVMILK
jgi:hypothetical protein